MTSVALVLGPVSFSAFEVPSGINFGGRQLLAIHQLTDGQRVIDSIGPVDTDISFSGVFSGPSATLRARTLNSLRTAGAQLSLTWDAFFYTVVLSLFDADYNNPVWIPYRISCTVLRDEATSAAFPPLALYNVISSDLTVAAAQCSATGIDFDAAQTSLAVPGATTLGSAAYAAAQTAIGAAQSAVVSQMNPAETTISSIVADEDTSPAALAANLNVVTGAAQQLAALSIGNAYLGRAARNLSSASS